MIVTIDGPAGSGKSTAARRLAVRLGFRFLDTGAMYRVVGLECLKADVDPLDEPAAARVAENARVHFDGGRVFSGTDDVTDGLRSVEVTDAASVVARYAGVRRAMDRRQRELAEGRNIITEGRDQGTVVFPDAECKFFLFADPRERARRRQREMQQQGVSVPLDELTAQIEERDHRDASRPVAPLLAAPDAVHLETSNLSIDEVVDRLEAHVRQRQAL